MAARLLKQILRIITATNRDLLKEIAEGRFRWIYITLKRFYNASSLRERKGDIITLANYFLKKLDEFRREK